MSDREMAREIVERLAYDEELDRNGQEALIATALAQVRAEALRRAAEVALAEKLTGVPPPNWDASDLAIAEGAARATAKSIASAILALIKEPGHE